MRKTGLPIVAIMYTELETALTPCATKIQRINDCYRMNHVFKKRLSCPFTISFRMSVLASVCLVATTGRILNERSALYTGSVPSAESLRPVKVNVSGPRWH